METKYCPSCQTDKCVTLFSWRNKSKKIKAPHCKVCYAAARRKDYHSRDKTKILLENKIRRQQNTKRFQVWKESLCCEICEEKEECTLDFHHKDPNEKEFNVGEMAQYYSWERVQFEASKCMVLCSNCHRKIHKYGLDYLMRV